MQGVGVWGRFPPDAGPWVPICAPHPARELVSACPQACGLGLIPGARHVPTAQASCRQRLAACSLRATPREAKGLSPNPGGPGSLGLLLSTAERGGMAKLGSESMAEGMLAHESLETGHWERARMSGGGRESHVGQQPRRAACVCMRHPGRPTCPSLCSALGSLGNWSTSQARDEGQALVRCCGAVGRMLPASPGSPVFPDPVASAGPALLPSPPLLDLPVPQGWMPCLLPGVPRGFCFQGLPHSCDLHPSPKSPGGSCSPVWAL